MADLSSRTLGGHVPGEPGPTSYHIPGEPGPTSHHIPGEPGPISYHIPGEPGPTYHIPGEPGPSASQEEVSIFGFNGSECHLSKTGMCQMC